MTGGLDPWRTLGLAPGSSIDEIRRAYRRLAKANHPDAAGESALPRFLAIQSAYESLAGPQRSRKPGSRPGPASTREPWRADPERGRASAGPDGRQRPSAGARPGGTKSDGSGPRPAAGSRPGAGPQDGAAGGDAPGADRPSSGRAKAGRPDDPGPARRGGGRRRAANRATPGSTSYDAADEEPFEPGWSGATWYGASSGTYWTINPREYADPRKHGPEYQRRARRSASGRWIVEGEPGIEPDADHPLTERDAADGVQQPDGPMAAEPQPSRHGPAGSGAAAPDAGQATPGGPDVPRPAAPRRPTWTSTGREPGERVPGENGPGGGAPPPDRPHGRPVGAPGDGFAAPLLRPPTTPAGRLGLALLGWPPLGVAVATAIGESTGCGRFAASCAEVFAPGTWIVQIAIVLLLLALPRLAGWSAVGTLVALAAAIPTAIALSAGGGSRQPEASAGLLLAVLGLAYATGVAWAVARRWWPSAGSRRVP